MERLTLLHQSDPDEEEQLRPEYPTGLVRNTVELRTSQLLKPAGDQLEAEGEMSIRDIRDFDVKFIPKPNEEQKVKPDTRSLPHTLTWKTAYNPRACARRCAHRPEAEGGESARGVRDGGSLASDAQSELLARSAAVSVSGGGGGAGVEIRQMDEESEETRQGWARYRSNDAVLKQRAKERATRDANFERLHASPSGIRAILVGQRVLARHKSDGLFYVGRVHSVVGREEYLVDFEARDPEGFRERHFWPVHVHDLIAFDDALLHPLKPGDKVLAPVLSPQPPVRKPQPPTATRSASAKAKVVQHEQLATRKTTDTRVPFAPASVVAGEESRQISEKDIQTPIEQVLYTERTVTKKSKKRSDGDSDDDDSDDEQKAAQLAAKFYEFEGVAELLKRPPAGKPIQVVFYTGESATIPPNTAIWIPVDAYNRLRLEATMPAHARGTLARTPGYPANSLPGYPTNGPNAKKQFDYFESRTVESDELLVDYSLPLRALPVYPILKRVPEIPAHSRLHSHLKESLTAADAASREDEAHKFPRHFRVSSQVDGLKTKSVQVEQIAYAERSAQTGGDATNGHRSDGRSLSEMEFFDPIRKEARWGVLAHRPPPTPPPASASPPYRPPAVASHATQTACENELLAPAHPVDELPAPGRGHRRGITFDDVALTNKCERHRLEAQLDRVRVRTDHSPRLDALLERRDMNSNAEQQLLVRHSRHPGRHQIPSPDVERPEQKRSPPPAEVRFASRERVLVDCAVGPDLLPDFRHSRHPGRHRRAESPDIFGRPQATPKALHGNQQESTYIHKYIISLHVTCIRILNLFLRIIFCCFLIIFEASFLSRFAICARSSGRRV